MPAVSLDHVSVTYGDREAVHDLSLTVAASSICVMLGPNGAGKTTTINTCLGLLRPASGSVRVLGLEPQADRQRLRQRVGVLLQEGGLPMSAKPVDILRHFAALHRQPHPWPALAERLGLTGLDRPYRRLSGGEQQRVKIAVALVGRPELLIMDEPTTGMDPAARREFWTLLDEVRQSGASVMMTTHQPDEAATRADQVVIVNGGTVIRAGTPEELIAESPVWFSAARHLDLSDLRGVLPSGADVEEVEPGRYRVSGQIGVADVASIQSWAVQHASGPQEFTVVRSLEEAYLGLTGDRAW